MLTRVLRSGLQVPSVARQFSVAAAQPKLYMALMGAPGVGKGTFAVRLGPHFGVPSISTGDLIRAEIKSGSALGQRLQAITDKGALVDDETMSEILRKRLTAPDTARGFLLDGYPRRLAQAEALQRLAPLDLVVNIDLREDVLITKISSRRVCERCGANYNLANIREGEIDMPPLLPKVDGVCDKCGSRLLQRTDDRVETVRDRLRIYHEQTQPLEKYYDRQGLLLNFQVRRGIGDLPELVRVISEFLSARNQNKSTKPTVNT